MICRIFLSLVMWGVLADVCAIVVERADILKKETLVVQPANPQMLSGEQLLIHADELRITSADVLAEANQLRRLIADLRKQKKSTTDKQAAATLDKTLQASIIAVQDKTKRGAQLRAQANDQVIEAKSRLQQGLIASYPSWIHSVDAFSLANLQAQSVMRDERGVDLGGVDLGGVELAGMVKAHNTAVQSVSPQMQGLARAEAVEARSGMSLAMSGLAGQQFPKNLDLSTFQLSRHRLYFAHIEREPSASTRTHKDIVDVEGSNAIFLNKLHSWRLVLTNLVGEPVSNVNIRFAGHMPGHVHGLPTQPRITDVLAPGVYVLDGVKFQMPGWWVLDFILDFGDSDVGIEQDSIRFNIVL